MLEQGEEGHLRLPEAASADRHRSGTDQKMI